MSEAEYPQNEMIQDENPPAGRRGKKLILLLLVLLLLGGGGGAGYYFFLRTPAETEGEEETVAEEKPAKEKKTKKKKKPAVSEEEEESDHKKSKSSESEIPDDGSVKNVVELQPFIVNLADAEQSRYLRMTVSVGVGGEGGGEEEKPNQLFVTKVRNAMIIVLSSKTSDDILSTEGKAKLRKELLKAAQSVSEEPHVEAIYITDFIIQM